MLTAYATVAIFFAVAGGFVLVSLMAGKLLRPAANKVSTDETYECGEAPVQQAWFNFNPRFYIITLIFIVFDVEIAFIYPVAVVFKRWVAAGWGLFAAVEIAIFMLILMVGLVYVWKKGDLEWLRNIRKIEESPYSEPIQVVRPAVGSKPAEPVAEEAA